MYKKIRIFVGSPGDVQKEKEKLAEIVCELNRPNGIADQNGLILELLEWHLATPQMGRPQKAIFDSFPVEEWDLFIGILWKKFGTPTGEINPKTTEPYVSGTEEEFDKAYNLWKETKKPAIQFYRSLASVNILEIDPKQLDVVNRFFDKFRPLETYQGLYFPYNGLDEFEKMIRRNIENYIKTIAPKKISDTEVKRNDVVSPAITTGNVYRPAIIIRNKLSSGISYPMAVVSIDVVDSTSLVSKYGARMQKIILSVNKMIYDAVWEHDGDVLNWAGDGGVLLFWGDDSCNRGVRACIKIIKLVSLLNFSKEFDSIGESVQLRIAMHWGMIEMIEFTEQLTSECISYVSHLEKNETQSGAFSITGIVINQIGEKLRELFQYTKFDGSYSIYVYSEEQKVTKDIYTENDFGNIVNKIETLRYDIVKTLEKSDFQGDTSVMIRNVRNSIDEAYNTIDKLYKYIANNEQSMAAMYLQTMIKTIQCVLDEDIGMLCNIDEANQRWMELYNGSFPMLKFIYLKRINSIPNLKNYLKRFKEKNGQVEAKKDKEKSFFEKLHKFIKSDEFSEEVAFMELVVTEREFLAEYLASSNDMNKPEYMELTSRFWRLADFVLLDDLMERKKGRQLGVSIILNLAKYPKNKKKFASLLRLVKEMSAQISKEWIVEQFKRNEIAPDDLDVTVALKCVLICNPNSNVRNKIMESLGVDKLWEIVSYERTPLYLLSDICKFIRRKYSSYACDAEDEVPVRADDYLIMFFELVEVRCRVVVKNAENVNALKVLLEMIEVFYQCNTFAYSPYFEKLEDMTLKLQEKIRLFPEIDRQEVENQIFTLKDLRKKTGSVRKHINWGVIKKLPLPIQRKLARMGYNVKDFIGHYNAVIAREAINHVLPDDVSDILKIKTIQNVIFLAILEKRALFGTNTHEAILLALNHPLCTVAFASSYISRTTKLERTKIANNSGANSAVRDYFRKNLEKK